MWAVSYLSKDLLVYICGLLISKKYIYALDMKWIYR